MRLDELTDDQKLFVRRALRRNEGAIMPITVWEVEGEGDDERDVRVTNEYFIGKMGADTSIRVLAVIAVAAMKGADIQKAFGKDTGFNPLLLLRMLDNGLLHELFSALMGETPQWVAEHWDFAGWVVPVAVRWAKHTDFLALKETLVNDVLPMLSGSKASV